MKSVTVGIRELKLRASELVRLVRETEVERIVSELKPEKIILFGSYAYGDPTPDSDVDLLSTFPLGHRPSPSNAFSSLLDDSFHAFLL